MITKVSKIGELYQINNSETPLDITSLRELLKESSTISNMNDWLDTLDEKGENEFELKTAEKGTVVNIYEVEYPTPSDPNKETQEMAASVNEYEDFITQNLFPGVTPEDIIVTQREHKEDIEEGPGRLFNQKELRDKAKNVKRGWKRTLSSTVDEEFFELQLTNNFTLIGHSMWESFSDDLSIIIFLLENSTETPFELYREVFEGDPDNMIFGYYEKEDCLKIPKVKRKINYFKKLFVGKTDTQIKNILEKEGFEVAPMLSMTDVQMLGTPIEEWNTEEEQLPEEQLRELGVITNKEGIIDLWLEIRYLDRNSDKFKKGWEKIQKLKTSSKMSYWSQVLGEIEIASTPIKVLSKTSQQLPEKELRERGKRGSKEHWKKVLSTTKTMPSPTKTPVKIPKREVPTKDPDKINPFRKPNINPSKEPQPKALPVVYPEGSKLKMHPDLEKVINIRDTPYHGLPQVPGGEYIENISSERFKLIIKNLEKYYGKKINTLKDIAPALQMVLIRIEEIESDYIEELEQLAILLVENYFGIERGEVEFDARLVRQVTLEDISNLSSSEEKDLEKKLPSLDLSLDVSKRRFINGLIQGAGINSLSMFHLVKDELMKMNPDLIGMYGLLTSFIELGYWITSPSLSGLALSNAPGAGKVKLDLSKEKPIIVSFAINFPVLVQELVKGVMELISSHGLPEDEELRNQVLEKADTLEDESWDIRFGPEIWKKLLSHLNITELNGRALSILYYSLIQMNSADFSDFVNQILSNKREGINKWNEMYQQALQQITKTTSLHVDREEREVEGYNRYRKIALLKGEIPKLYYEWINE